MANAKSYNHPVDRLTTMLADVGEFIKEHDLFEEDDKGILCLVGMDEGQDRGGIFMFGYDDEREAVYDALLHMRAVAESSGLHMAVIPVNKG